MFLTYVGCDGFFAPATAPRTRVNLGPGRRAPGPPQLRPGPVRRRAPRPAPTSPSSRSPGPARRSSVHGGRGHHRRVLHLDVGAGRPGRPRLARSRDDDGARRWLAHVDTATLRYDWQLVDLVTGSAPPGAAATPAEFVAAHGDGPGYVVTGFGCDGRAFNVDAVRGVGQTWDFEGVDPRHLDHRLGAPGAGRPGGRHRRPRHRRRRPGDRRPGGPPGPHPRAGGVARGLRADPGRSRRLVAGHRRRSPRTPSTAGSVPRASTPTRAPASRSRARGPGAGSPSRARPRATLRPRSSSRPRRLARLGRMAPPSTSPSVEIDVDDRVVRVSNPDRVYFPPTASAPSGATKLDLVEYYLAVGARHRQRALRAAVHAAPVPQGPGRRQGAPEAAAGRRPALGRDGAGCTSRAGTARPTSSA